MATVLSTYQDYIVLLPGVEDDTLDPRDRLAALAESLAAGFEAIAHHLLLTHQAWSVVLNSPAARQELLGTLRSIYSGYTESLQSILAAGIERGVLRADIDISVVATNWLAIYDGLLYRAGFEEDEPDPAYTAAGVRRSLGWLIQQLLVTDETSTNEKIDKESVRT
jgi:hypothetical protein